MIPFSRNRRFARSQDVGSRVMSRLTATGIWCFGINTGVETMQAATRTRQEMILLGFRYNAYGKGLPDFNGNWWQKWTKFRRTHGDEGTMTVVYTDADSGEVLWGSVHHARVEPDGLVSYAAMSY